MRLLSRSTVLTGLGAAAAASALPLPLRAQTAPETVAVAGVFSDLFAEPFYAKDAGTFAKAGFAIQTSSLNNAGAVAAAIGGGTLQLGTGDLVSGVNAINAGVPIVLVAGGGMFDGHTDSGSAVLAVMPDSPIHAPKDLVGKKIAIPTLVGLTTACLRTWLTARGVDVASVQLVELPQSASFPALQRGEVDVAFLSEPFATFARGASRSLGSPYDAAADLTPTKTFCVSVWYANKPWFEADPARARRAVAAIYDTARWANTNRDATFAILVRDGKLDADRAKGMMRTTFATNLTPELISPVIQIATQNKMFAKPVDPVALITKV